MGEELACIFPNSTCCRSHGTKDSERIVKYAGDNVMVLCLSILIASVHLVHLVRAALSQVVPQISGPKDG